MLQKRDPVSWHFIYNLDKASELKVEATNNIKILIVIALRAILRARQTQSSFYCYLLSMLLPTYLQLIVKHESQISCKFCKIL